MTLLTTLPEHDQFLIQRRRAHVHQSEIGRRVGISQSVVSRWEKGKVHLPRPRVDQLWAALATIQDEGEQA